MFAIGSLAKIAEAATVIPCVVSLPSQVAGFTWNQRPICRGISGRFAVESVADFTWNTQALVKHVFPGAVLSYKSACLGGPDETGALVVSHGNRAGMRTYPGLAVEVRPGRPLPGDTPYGALFIASENRWLLECLDLVKGSSNRTLPPERIEAYLEKILDLRGERGLNALRDSARLFAESHGLGKAFKRLDHLTGALLKTREAGVLTSKRALARAAGKPYDPDRLRLFDVLFAGLQQAGLPEISDVTGTPRARDNQAFFEAYFSNYIEGTTFTVEEAEAIIYDGAVLTNRLEDSHDILGTYRPRWPLQIPPAMASQTPPGRTGGL